MLITYFTEQQVSLLIASGICLLSGLYFHFTGKETIAVSLLVLTALLLFSFAALLDPFLNIWDERFHALAAKNLMKHPLMPTLYDDPVVQMAYDRWDKFHIWVHKQPLFLWQIALCFRLFGVNEFALRLPDVILGTFMVFAGYRSGKLLVNKNTGYFTGILIIPNFYHLELISGRQALEHNDFVFMVYISLSIWTFIEYYFSKKTYWILLTGLFSGCAILTKWLVGLLVYAGWFFVNLAEKKVHIKHQLKMFPALLITIIIALPWQMLTFLWYPTEAAIAYKFNVMHFTQPLEGHIGTQWYYLENFTTLYGHFAPLLIVPAFALLYKKARSKGIVISFIGMMIIVYSFFTFTATKMPSFPTVTSLAVFIAFASLIDYIIGGFEKMKIPRQAKITLFISCLFVLAVLNINMELLQEKHTLWKSNNDYSRMLMHNKKIFRSLDLPPQTVLFNVKGRHYIEAMFYTGFPAYNFVPSYEQYLDMKAKQRTMAVFRPPDMPLPDYLEKDLSVIVLNEILEGYE